MRPTTSEKSHQSPSCTKAWTLLAKRGDEISLEALAAEERKLFEQSDEAE